MLSDHACDIFDIFDICDILKVFVTSNSVTERLEKFFFYKIWLPEELNKVNYMKVLSTFIYLKR